MFNVRLAGGHLYGKQLFTWLSLVVSFMASFMLSFFPLDVLDGIWDLIESVSEGFLTYFGIEDLDLILKERRFCWYGHVERSNGAVKTAFDIQVDGKCGPGRPKMTWR